MSERRITTKGRVTTSAGESEEIMEYRMKLTGPDQAELQILPGDSGFPAPKPWKLERSPAAK